MSLPKRPLYMPCQLRSIKCLFSSMKDMCMYTCFFADPCLAALQSELSLVHAHGCVQCVTATTTRRACTAKVLPTNL